ncbi:hypothetical protein RFI_12309, partial [Reticulomyxa filosa]
MTASRIQKKERVFFFFPLFVPLAEIMGHSNSKKLWEYARNGQENEAIQLLDSCNLIDPNYPNVGFRVCFVKVTYNFFFFLNIKVYRESPLHLACANNMTKLVKKLIEHGAKVDVKNRFESTPLHIATRMGHQEIAKLLLEEAKCDPNIPGAYDFRAITIACAVGNISIVRLLLEHNAFIEDKTLMLAAMQEPKARTSRAQTKRKTTPMKLRH